MNLEEELLRTLSFYEPMSLEHIFLDLDKSFLDTFDTLTTEDLLNSLAVLSSKSLIQVTGAQDQKMWIRVTPKKSLSRRAKDLIQRFLKL